VRSVTDSNIAKKPPVDDATAGSRVWSNPTDGERRHVTVLFIDLAHSSDFVADADPEDANDIVLPVIRRFVEIVESVGGTVTQVLGDGVMAVFGTPAALEDHALKACRAAERLRDQATSGALVDGWIRGIPFDIRIGISSGEVVAQTLRPGRSPEYRTTGEAVYLASRMEQLAKPNGIWITEDTVALLRGRAKVRQLGRFSVAPGSQGKVFFELVELGDSRVAPRPRRVKTPTRMFGRSVELIGIANLLADGRGGTVVVAGGPGIGKSRFVQELTKRPEAQHHRIVAIAATPPGFASPYEDPAALAGQVLGLPDGLDAVAAETAVEEALGAIGLAKDERIGDLAGALGGQSDLGRTRQPEGQFARAVSLLSDAVFAISRDRPVLAVVEDVHWASSILRRFAADIARDVGDRSVLLVITTRNPAEPFVGDLPIASLIPLTPLSEEDSQALLAQLLGKRQDLAPLKDRLIQNAQGNPLFLIESASALVQDAVLSAEGTGYQQHGPLQNLTVPSTIQDILATRLDSLTASERSALLAASVIGLSFDLGLLSALVEGTPGDLCSVIDRLQEKGFVELTRTSPSTEYSFRHALIHDVAYRTLLKKTRRDMHGRLLDETRKRPSSLIFGKADLLADHAFRAERWTLAYVYCRRAGEAAQMKSWNLEAETHFRHALTALKRLPKTSKTDRRRLELVAGVVRSLFALGRYDEARALLDDAPSFPECSDLKRIGCEIASLRVLCHWAVSSLREAETAARLALDMARDTDDTGLQISCAGRLGIILTDKGDFERGHQFLAAAQRAIPEGRRHDTFGLMAVASVACRGVVARNLAERGKSVEADELSREAITIADDADHVFTMIYANLIAAVVRVRARYPEQSLSYLERASSLCDASRFWSVKPLVTGFLGLSKVLSGSVIEGLDLLDDSLDAAEFPSLMIRQSIRRAWIAEGYLSAGLADKSLSIASAALATARTKGEIPAEAMCLRIIGESRLHLAGGADPEAAKLLRQARTLSQQFGMRPQLAQCEIALGELGRLAGRPQEAEAHFDRAARIFEACGMKPLSPEERAYGPAASIA